MPKTGSLRDWILGVVEGDCLSVETVVMALSPTWKNLLTAFEPQFSTVPSKDSDMRGYAWIAKSQAYIKSQALLGKTMGLSALRQVGLSKARRGAFRIS